MSGLHEVACGACGKRHVMSAARARSQRVLRCDCGQFVRLDRTLAETHSDPAPAPAPDPELEDALDDEETHMFSSLEAIAALGSASRNTAPRTSTYDGDDAAATRVASSPVNLSPSVPPARPSAPARRPSSPVSRAAPAASDKPLWYVDLGGTETVEMTIEQLIIARRSGKLGEGALVWRAGMPRWRPIGALIPAAGSGAPRQSAPPAVPVRAKPAAPQALGSYERPLATLEFALEKSEIASPRERPARTPSPAKLTPSSQPPPRAPTPIPRVPARGASQVGPLPAPPLLPGSAGQRASSTAGVSLPAPTPLPTPPSDRPARLMTSMSPMLQRSSPMPPPRSIVPAVFQYPWRGQRPRWLSVGIAVLICVAASGSGAFVVRALKIRRQPLSLSPTQLSTAPVAAAPALPSTAEPAPTPAPARSTEVIDIDSLSVEHHAPRAPVRPAAPVVTAAPAVAPNPDKAGESADSDDTAATAPAPAAKKAKAGDLPAVAHSNPYTTGATDTPTKKPAPASSEDPGF